VMSDETGRESVEALLQRMKEETRHLLGENRPLVDALRDALIEREELLGDEILQVLTDTQRTLAGESAPHPGRV